MTNRVRLTQDIIDPACGDHPALLIASRGEVAEVVNANGRVAWSLYVKIGERELGLKSGEWEVVDEA